MAQYRRLGGILVIALATTTGLTACGFGGSTGDDGAEGGATTLDLLVPSYSDAHPGPVGGRDRRFRGSQPGHQGQPAGRSRGTTSSRSSPRRSRAARPRTSTTAAPSPASPRTSCCTRSRTSPPTRPTPTSSRRSWRTPRWTAPRTACPGSRRPVRCSSTTRSSRRRAPRSPTTWDELLESATKVSDARRRCGRLRHAARFRGGAGRGGRVAVGRWRHRSVTSEPSPSTPPRTSRAPSSSRR